MSDTTFATDAGRSLDQPFSASPADYFALLKPRVMSLVVFTALAGLLLAPTPPHPVLALASLIAIAMGGGASGALNMWYEADIDRLMVRTSGRPIPAGRLNPEEALAFGLVLAGLSVLTLGLAANWLAAALLAFTIFFYVVIYTMWLKRATPMNIVIGGAAGALPPIVAYAAATGEMGLASIVLFAIIFVWTPPHFWALALVKNEDYTRAGVPMLPVVAGPDRTRLEILLYTLVLVPLGLAPCLLGFASAAYGVAAVVLGAAFLWCSWRVYALREGAAASKAAWRLFGFSIAYLFLLFSILVIERLLSLSGVVL
ncbi:heme o synthase [Methylocystis bryophila]|uniref:Protoheme IX farnesyltransferase n=1 Tax=Methylocystis bryophila TaxID=655015 RepID=A0A1W6N047_9HYPH|nr:heme o synthase [Methylocystis bryophila]ARN83244.1 protoheme IX farnesyltransferase [Methylocystis bryophila]BDV39604.1 protoheme IX farnesyltransferase [Methylocystis bryophila]